MASNTLFSARNEVKLDLGGICNQSAPRHFFSTREPLEMLFETKVFANA